MIVEQIPSRNSTDLSCSFLYPITRLFSIKPVPFHKLSDPPYPDENQCDAFAATVIQQPICNDTFQTSFLFIPSASSPFSPSEEEALINSQMGRILASLNLLPFVRLDVMLSVSFKVIVSCL